MIGMAKGMLTTLRFCFTRAATEQYPYVKKTLPERSRTMFTLPLNDDGQPACKACLLCEKNCPTGAIELGTEKRADGPGRVLTQYRIDLGLCMYCGICVEGCPSAGIEFCGDYERATSEKSDTRLVLWDEPYEPPAAAPEPSTGADDVPPVVPEAGEAE